MDRIGTIIRRHVSAGYETFTGEKFNEVQALVYNSMQDQINSYIVNGLTVPNHLLNASHKYLDFVANSKEF